MNHQKTSGDHWVFFCNKHSVERPTEKENNMARMNIVGTTDVEYTPESEQITVGNFSTDTNAELTENVGNSDYGNISIPGELLGEEPQEQSTQEEITEQAETTKLNQKKYQKRNQSKLKRLAKKSPHRMRIMSMN